MGRTHKSVLGSSYLIEITLPPYITYHAVFVEITIQPALHSMHMPTSNATVKSGTICPSSIGGKPGSSKLHRCVNLTTLPLGKLMVRGFVAGQIFLIGFPFNTMTKVAPVSATACVSGIAGFVGCMQEAHTSICFVLMEVTTVLPSMLTSRFWVGYKVGSETNGFKHFNSTYFAPHHHILGN
jgi:hypothetical protein